MKESLSQSFVKGFILLHFYRSFKKKLEESRERLIKELMEWLDWAGKKVDWYVPFITGDDDIFQDVDRDFF